MRELARSIHLTGAAVPVPWSNLGYYVKPRTGNLMAVAAASGVGKSLFALTWATSIGLPCLYVSLDQSLVDQAIRLLAMRLQKTVDQIMDGQERDHDEWARRWSDELLRFRIPVRFADHVKRGLEDVEEIIVADTEYWGRAPAITVIDNVADLVESEESASEYHRVFQGLKKMAKDHDTLVMALHHLRRKPPRQGEAEHDQGTKPVMKTDILYGGDREVQYLLGMWRPRPDTLKVSVLKNRMGQADSSSNLNAVLKVDFPRATIHEDQLETYRDAMFGERDRRREEQ